MPVEPFELNEKISQMSDEELLRVVGVDAAQYRQEALDHAKTEMARRGLAPEPQASDIRCVKCAAGMEVGFIPDFGDYEYVRPLRWIEGKPEKSFWTGTKIGNGNAANVTAYRCTACGYLELYAVEEASQ